jgi:hypothetical protein
MKKMEKSKIKMDKIYLTEKQQIQRMKVENKQIRKQLNKMIEELTQIKRSLK